MAQAKRYAPSSSTAGFFQERPKLENQFHDDDVLRRMMKFYLPPQVKNSVYSDLEVFGKKVISPQVLTWTADAEQHPPYLKTWDTFGNRRDELVTSEGWRRLQDLGIAEGIVAIPYEDKHGASSRVYQFLKYHIWTGSCVCVTCPSAMTDGAAAILSRHLASTTSLSAELRPVLQAAYQRLVSRDPATAWTSGQWMTERQGGSDVSKTETIAVPAAAALGKTGVDGSPLGGWSISGFKWFSSATDADMSVLLARTPSGNISAFFAPMRRTVTGSNTNATEFNGVSIQRLKEKLGTRALPTAELVLDDMRGWLLGAEGQGVKEISTILNITRIHTAVSAVSMWGRGLAISRAFARVRIVGGRKLMDLPAHTKTMAENSIEYRGHMHLTYFAVLLLGISEQSSLAIPKIAGEKTLKRIVPSHGDAQLLLRILTPTVKALASKAGIVGLAECMESLGGVGYLENGEMEFNIARLFRDVNVLSIWEGTTDVLASDLVRVLKGKNGRQVRHALTKWAKKARVGDSNLDARLGAWVSKAEAGTVEELTLDGRELMYELGRIVMGLLLALDAESDGDVVAQEVASRWNGSRSAEVIHIQERVAANRAIAFGSPTGITTKLKL